MGDGTDKNVRNASLRSILNGVSIFFIGKISGTSLGFAVTLLLTRYLGVEIYGIYAFANTIRGAASPLSNLGADRALLRYLPKYEDSLPDSNETLSIAAATVLLGSTTAAILMWLTAPWINHYTLDTPELPGFLRLFSILLPISALIKISTTTFRANEQLEYTVFISRFVWPGLKLLAVGSVILLSLSSFDAVASLVVAGAITLIIGIYLFISRTQYSLRIPKDTIRIKEYLSFSLPLSVKDVGQLLYRRIDILMVGIFLPANAVGVYSVAFTVSRFVSLPLDAMNQLFPPIASRLYSTNSSDELNKIFSTVTRWAITASIPIVLGGILYRTELLSIFGDGFTTGATILLLFILGEFLNVAVGPSGYMLMMTDHQYLLSINQWIFGIVNIILNYIFIMKFGILGAALASVTALGVLNIVRVGELWYLEGYHPFTFEIWKPIAAGVIAGLLMKGVGAWVSGILLLVVGGIVGGLAFLGTLYILGIEHSDEQLIEEYLQGRS